MNVIFRKYKLIQKLWYISDLKDKKMVIAFRMIYHIYYITL